MNQSINDSTPRNWSEFPMDSNDVYRSPMDILPVKIIFILLYVVVFLTCFIGNSLVIIVIAAHHRMRTVTNFFLANLAVSDFCVGTFCILPNMSTYLSPFWILGSVMCKLYYYIQTTCYTASVAILAVISLERYVAIIFPMHSRRLHSMRLLVTVVVGVWLFAALSGVHYLVIFDTRDVPASGDTVQICVTVHYFIANLYVVVNVVIWYAVPLMMMTAVYTHISIVLWRSSSTSSSVSHSCGHAVLIALHTRHHTTVNALETETSNNQRVIQTSPEHAATERYELQSLALNERRQKTGCAEMSTSSRQCADESTSGADNGTSVLRSRRKVIRLLVAVVVSFAFCVLPYHVRVIWQTFTEPQILNDWHLVIPPLTFIAYYLNSAMNPVLYAFLSDRFRSSLRDVLRGQCSRRSRSSSAAAT